MIFRVVDILFTSRNVKFIFSNDETYQLTVKSDVSDGGLFEPYRLYKIEISNDVSVQTQKIHNPQTSINYSKLGVVVRKTRNSTHIASGNSHWSFPKNACSLRPGTAVWISVISISENNKSTKPQNS